MIIEKILALDCETTGFSKGSDITSNHQMVSLGLIVADTDFNPIDKFYVEIKWNETSNWDKYAEKIHGLSKEYLDQYGETEEDAALMITEFILKYFTPDDYIVFLGHNPKNFDVPFLLKLLNKFEIYPKVAHRTVDSFSVGFTALKAMDSNQLFDYFYPKRKEHNALQDAEMSLGACRNVRKLMQELIDG